MSFKTSSKTRKVVGEVNIRLLPFWAIFLSKRGLLPFLLPTFGPSNHRPSDLRHQKRKKCQIFDQVSEIFLSKEPDNFRPKIRPKKGRKLEDPILIVKFWVQCIHHLSEYRHILAWWHLSIHTVPPYSLVRAYHIHEIYTSKICSQIQYEFPPDAA